MYFASSKAGSMGFPCLLPQRCCFQAFSGFSECKLIDCRWLKIVNYVRMYLEGCVDMTYSTYVVLMGVFMWLTLHDMGQVWN